jgi:hypothetical protein
MPYLLLHDGAQQPGQQGVGRGAGVVDRQLCHELAEQGVHLVQRGGDGVCRLPAATVDPVFEPQERGVGLLGERGQVGVHDRP